MSLEIQAVHAKLKEAIQNHQRLVGLRQGQEDDETLKQQLLKTQEEILHWSKEQKKICQAINSNYGVVAKAQSGGQPLSQPSPAPAAGGPTPLATPKPLPASKQLLSPAPALTVVSVPVAHVQAVHQVTLPVGAVSAVTVNPAAVLPTDLSVKTEPNMTPQPSPTPSKPPNSHPPPQQRASPPIRVPQYPVSNAKAATLLGGKPSAMNPRTHMPPPDSNRSRRTLSDSDIRDSRDNSIRAIVERKQLSPKTKKKLEYMAALNLVTPETLKEVQNKRSERKRRSTANPQFSYNFEPDRKHFKNYLTNSSLNGGKRPRGRPPKQSPTNSHPSSPDSPTTFHFKNGFVRNGSAEMESQEEICAKCGQETPSLQCHSCRLFYHDHCLGSPPSPSLGTWTCPKCSNSNHRSPWSNPTTLAKVNTYIANKAAKEDERKKIQKKNSDLQNEMSQLEAKSKEMRDSHNEQLERKKQLEEAHKETQEKVAKVKDFVHQFRV